MSVPELQCKFCGATGLTVTLKGKAGTPFRNEDSLKRHEVQCIKNPNRTKYHRHKKLHKGKGGEITLRILTELNDGTLLCANGAGDMFKAERVRIKVESV